MNRLEIYLLGSPEVRYEGETLSCRSAKALALLVYLLVEAEMQALALYGVLVDPVQNPTLSFQPIQVQTLIIALFPARFLSSGLIRSAPPKS